MTADVFYNELDAYPAQWLRNLIAAGHLPAGQVDGRSIVDLGPEDCQPTSHFFAGIGGWPLALSLAGWPDDRPVWTGSCPCQPFSAAGKRGGTDDPRHLWPEWFRLIRECRPPVIFGEQVASRGGLAWLDIVSADLEGEAYAVAALDLCAAGFGAPHIRQRLYFVAHAADGRNERRHGPTDGPRETARFRSSLDDRDGCAIGFLANPDGRDAGAEGLQRGGQHGQWEEDGQSCGLADASGGRGGAQFGDDVPRPSEPDASGRGPVNNFWRDAIWLACTDGKARPAQPGILPLAGRLPARVGRLRAYGNAVVVPQAVEFVRAYMAVAA